MPEHSGRFNLRPPVNSSPVTFCMLLTANDEHLKTCLPASTFIIQGYTPNKSMLTKQVSPMYIIECPDTCPVINLRTPSLGCVRALTTIWWAQMWFDNTNYLPILAVNLQKFQTTEQNMDLVNHPCCLILCHFWV